MCGSVQAMGGGSGVALTRRPARRYCLRPNGETPMHRISAPISSCIFSQFSRRTFAGLALLAALLFALLAPPPAAAEKVIKDQAEYNAYIAALNIADPVKKSAAMESFLKKFPNSIVKVDALEQAMAAYQAAGNAGQVEATAGRILQLEA